MGALTLIGRRLVGLAEAKRESKSRAFISALIRRALYRAGRFPTARVVANARKLAGEQVVTFLDLFIGLNSAQLKDTDSAQQSLAKATAGSTPTCRKRRHPARLLRATLGSNGWRCAACLPS